MGLRPSGGTLLARLWPRRQNGEHFGCVFWLQREPVNATPAPRHPLTSLPP